MTSNHKLFIQRDGIVGPVRTVSGGPNQQSISRESVMTQNQQYDPIKFVGRYDDRWIIEAVQFQFDNAQLTQQYPRWFVEILCDQNPQGFVIQFNNASRAWWLRCRNNPDYLIEDGDSWVVKNPLGDVFVCSNAEFERVYRRFVLDVDKAPE